MSSNSPRPHLRVIGDATALRVLAASQSGKCLIEIAQDEGISPTWTYALLRRAKKLVERERWKSARATAADPVDYPPAA